MSHTQWTLRDYLGKRLVDRQTWLSRFIAFCLHIPFKLPWAILTLFTLVYLFTH